MGELRIILAYARHGMARLAFTAGSILVAFVLLGLMLPVIRVFESRVDFGAADRLMVLSKTSMMTPLPISLRDRIAEIDGVEAVSSFTFFGGTYRSPSNRIAAIVTDPRTFPDMVDEIAFNDPVQLEAWQSQPATVAIGRELADKEGWKVGDLVPIGSMIYPRRDGNPVWTFRVTAIFDPATAEGVTNSMVINYDYFNEERAAGRNTVGWFTVRVGDARNAEAVAAAIERTFANSPAEVTATTEKAYAQNFLRQVGNFKTMITIALALVFWTLILITSNAMMQGIRQRFSDFAIMRTLGFGRGRIGRLIFSEVLLLVVTAATIGMAVANLIVVVIASRTDQLLSLMRLDWRDWAIAAALVAGCAVIVAALPIMRTSRQKIVDGLGEAVQ